MTPEEFEEMLTSGLMELTQTAIEAEVLLVERRIQEITEPEIEALFEEAAMELALRTVAAKMRARMETEQAADPIRVLN